jgi:sugar phosphate isomerase/epimerase
MFDCSRRMLLTSLAGVAASALLAGCSPGRLRKSSPPLSRYGIAIYMLGDAFDQDPAGTMRQVAALGYSEVELPHFYNRTPAALAEAIRGAGLACPSIHIPLDPMYPGTPSLGDPEKVISAARTLGATYVVAPLFSIPPRLARAPAPGETGPQMVASIGRAMTADDWRQVAVRLNAAASTLADAGLRLAYHNHNVEFQKLDDGRTAFDLLLAETDPSKVALELDLGWVAAAGLDPVEMINRCKGRVRLVHVRDLHATASNTMLNMNYADVGGGTLDWPSILPAAVDAGVEHFYVEQDPPFPQSPLASAANAMRFLRGL